MPELRTTGRGAPSTCARVPSEEPGMSPREIWCNEAQERYVLASRRSASSVRAICERERCPFAVLGTPPRTQADGEATSRFGNDPVDLPMDVLFGKPPKMHRDVRAGRAHPPPLRRRGGIDLKDAALRVLRMPAVADKNFLITIGDRTVGGCGARPDGRPVAGAGGRLRRHPADFDGLPGEALRWASARRWR
jgi:phosphoribosylformylglycinamidine synthase